eukprot:s1586_g3.t1
MYRNHQYDMDCITWSPAGRILQVEYAMEAVKQGTPVLGLRSKECVVLVSFKRAQSELASHQQKIFKIDDNMAIGISGLTADARVLADYMRNECLNHRYVFDSAMNVGRLVAQVADKSQQKTQNSSKRPYGVGLLVAGCDEKGPHLFETCPSGNYFEYYAMAIGGRSTSAKTFLEKHFADFETADVDALVKHGLEAMNKTTSWRQIPGAFGRRSSEVHRWIGEEGSRGRTHARGAYPGSRERCSHGHVGMRSTLALRAWQQGVETS